MQTVLSIAGFDPSSGAGITADLMVFAAHGMFGTSCITNLTIQTTVGVFETHPVADDIVRKTLECLQTDLPVAGIKIGMLSEASTVEVVAEFVENLRRTEAAIPIVLDPVLCSSSGRELLSPAGLELLKCRLLPIVNWVTPNVDELRLLSGESVKCREDMLQAVQRLRQTCPNLNVVATGGHLERPDDLLLTARGEVEWLAGQFITSRSTHGTGCAFASALLSRLVVGNSPYDASSGAKRYVAEAIRSATVLGKGKGPLNLLWPMQTQTNQSQSGQGAIRRIESSR